MQYSKKLLGTMQTPRLNCWCTGQWGDQMLTLDLQQHFGNLDAEPTTVSSLMSPVPKQ